jgi:ABC-type sugar transport system permease subunit
VYTPQFICLLVLVVATVLFTSLYFVTNMKYLDLDLGFVRSTNFAKIFPKTLRLSHRQCWQLSARFLGRFGNKVWHLGISSGFTCSEGIELKSPAQSNEHSRGCNVSRARIFSRFLISPGSGTP